MASERLLNMILLFRYVAATANASFLFTTSAFQDSASRPRLDAHLSTESPRSSCADQLPHCFRPFDMLVPTLREIGVHAALSELRSFSLLSTVSCCVLSNARRCLFAFLSGSRGFSRNAETCSLLRRPRWGVTDGRYDQIILSIVSLLGRCCRPCTALQPPRAPVGIVAWMVLVHWGTRTRKDMHGN